MHLILTALGSYGDVLPMAGLAAAMQARGHDVGVVSNPYFAPVMESAGVELLPLGTVDEYHELTESPKLWHSIKGPMYVLKTSAVELLPRLYGFLESHLIPGRTMLGAHNLDLACRVLQSEGRAPMATLLFAPLALRAWWAF